MTVRVTCGVAFHKASNDLTERIYALGLKPIITNTVIRTVYEGDNRSLAEKIVEIYQQEKDADIYYDDGRRGERCVDSNVGRKSRTKKKGKR